ncbi:MAG: FecR domain-containing protein, partial [Nitrospinota bacterium]
MMEGRRAETLRLGMVGVCIAGLVAALAPQAQGQERLGLLTASRGQVSIVRATPPPGRVVPVRARVREELFAGDVVKTGVRAKAKLLLRDDSLIILAGGTELEITQALFEPAAGRRSTTVRLLQGIARAVVQPIDNPRPDSRFSIETPTAVMGVRGSEGACQVTKKDGKWKTKC